MKIQIEPLEKNKTWVIEKTTSWKERTRVQVDYKMSLRNPKIHDLFE